jgi:hypothetical protein
MGCHDFDSKSQSLSVGSTGNLLLTHPEKTSNLYQTEQNHNLHTTELDDSLEIEEGIRACRVRESLKAQSDVNPKKIKKAT